MIRLLITGLLVISSASAAISADPQVRKQDLFRANESGYAHYRIPGIVATKSGTLLAYCEARKDARSDWGKIDIMMRRSTDSGTIWSDPEVVISPPADARKNEAAVAQGLGEAGQITMNNPVAIAAADGSVHFLWCVEYARCFYMRSKDDGATWSDPLEITGAFEGFRPYAWKVIATGPGHGIELRGGRLLVPVWLSSGTGGHAHRPSVISTIFSDDGGATWKAGAVAAGEFNPDNPSETSALELADGRVMLNFRHESPGRGRGITISPDGAGSWSPVRFDAALPEPVCMGSILRLTVPSNSDRGRVLFSNPANPIDRQRRNLTVRLSYDEGSSWPVARTIESGISGYSDIAVGADGKIHCFYERGTASESQYNVAALTVASFPLEWLTRGLDSL